MTIFIHHKGQITYTIVLIYWNMTDNTHINIKQVMTFLIVLIGMLVLFGVVTKENVIEAVSAMLVLTLILKELLPDKEFESKK